MCFLPYFFCPQYSFLEGNVYMTWLTVLRNTVNAVSLC